MNIATPYLLFTGDSSITKTAEGVRYWRPENCLAQLPYPGNLADLQLPNMSVAQAVAAGARTLLLGVAIPGGQLPVAWLDILHEALDSGLDIASGLHTRLNDIESLRARAEANGRKIFDVRHTEHTFTIDDCGKRPGKRLLTVGTDCSVGKMYTALAIEREMHARGIKGDFRATGQTGILISGEGISVDAVVADFIAAASAYLSPANDPDHWDVIEGQGSLFHPAYAGVTLGLIHGSQPDAMVLCTDPMRTRLAEFECYAQPSLQECIDQYTSAASLTNPAARVIGIAMNTSRLSGESASALLNRTQDKLGLPCVDPVRTGVAPLVDDLLT